MYKKTKPLINLDTWLDVVEAEYLDDYICHGGAAVKFVSGDEQALEKARAGLQALAKIRDYYTVFLDCSSPASDGKSRAIHRVDKLYFEITKDFDWRRWARRQAQLYLEANGLTVPDGSQVHDIDEIAAYNGRDVQDLINQYQREFATPQLKDLRLSVEFRTAITALGRSQLIPDSLSPTTEQVLLDWFRGKSQPGAGSALKKVQIFERINLANARTMLASFCRWLPTTGHKGIVLVIDFRAYEYKRESKSKRQEELIKRYENAILSAMTPEEMTALIQETEQVPDIIYSDGAYAQMLIMLRRFIDEIDTLDNILICVLTSPKFYKDKTTDPSVKRCYFDYDALQTRIGQEVHDENRANPAASLVELEETS